MSTPSILMYRGDKKGVRCYVTAESGDDLDISKAWFTAKEGIEDTDLAAKISLNTADDPTQITIENNNGPQPSILVTLQAADTDTLEPATYVFDFQIILSGDSSPYTVYVGYLVIKAEVTRSYT